MIGYMDRTYCPYYKSCEMGDVCNRALTPQVEADAVMWWGGENAPIVQFAEPPECYENINS